MLQRRRFPGIFGKRLHPEMRKKRLKALRWNISKDPVRLGRGEKHAYIRRITPSGYRRIRFRQYKLLAFIDAHFDGNVSKCARFLDMCQPALARVIDKGLFGRVLIERITRAFAQFDPGVTPKSLFIFPEFVKLPKRSQDHLPEPILPVRGSFSSGDSGIFSKMLDKYK